MTQEETRATHNEKLQTLFAQSHKLLTAAKELAQAHASELEWKMKQSVEMAKLAASNDFEKIKIAQKQATQDTINRLKTYQSKAESILEEMNDELQINSHKIIDKARSHLTIWIEDTRNLVHDGEKNIGRLAKNISEAGENLYQEGYQIMLNATEMAERELNNLAKEKRKESKNPEMRN